MKWKIKDIFSPTYKSENYEMWGHAYDPVDKGSKDGKLTDEQIYKLLDNMDISLIENYIRDKKLKKIRNGRLGIKI